MTLVVTDTQRSDTRWIEHTPGADLSRLLLVAALASGLLVPSFACAQDPASLKPLISAKYPDVRWVTTKTLAQWLRHPKQKRPVLLDVRTSDEYAVSTIRGARRLDPATPDIESLKVAPDARVVVFCSVGYRSAAVVEKLAAAGIKDVYNVEGGIFQWSNEGRPLFRGKTRVTRVHPYDRVWGRMLNPEHRALLKE